MQSNALCKMAYFAMILDLYLGVHLLHAQLGHQSYHILTNPKP